MAVKAIVRETTDDSVLNLIIDHLPVKRLEEVKDSDISERKASVYSALNRYTQRGTGSARNIFKDYVLSSEPITL